MDNPAVFNEKVFKIVNDSFEVAKISDLPGLVSSLNTAGIIVAKDAIYLKAKQTHVRNSNNDDIAVFNDDGSLNANLINADTITVNHLYAKSAQNGSVVGHFGNYDKSDATAGDTKCPLWLGATTAANAPFRVTKEGNMYARNANIEGRIVGSLRNPFYRYNEGFSIVIGGFEGFDYCDNLAISESADQAGWIHTWELSWDKTQSGRRINIINYRWGDSYSGLNANINAPSGKYFYENGKILKEINVYARERVELLGFGTNDTFHGWIVLSRQEIDSNQKYGKNLKCLAFGTIKGTSSGATVEFTTFDGSVLSVSKTSVGMYNLSIPTSWGIKSGKLYAMATGLGSTIDVVKNPLYASVYSFYLTAGVISTVSFQCGDNESRNDGSIQFMLFNKADFE